MERSTQAPLVLLAFLLVTAGCSGDASGNAVDAEAPSAAAVGVGNGEDVVVTDQRNASTASGEIGDAGSDSAANLTYPIVDTDQTWCFSEDDVIACGDDFVGQDAQYEGLQSSYQDNGDGTVTDLNTGLMWIQDAGDKTDYADAMEELETYSFAGYDDWRLPTVKELYSLALFSGVDASMASSSDVDGLWPLINDDYFVFLYGDESNSNRVIDAQWLTSSVYTSSVNGNQSCFFGFNFSDGRIKCYSLEGGLSGGYYAQYVRGSTEYGVNDYHDNGDGTVDDLATGLTWTTSDNGETYDWAGALDYCESLVVGSNDGWRLPNIKELQSIVDYDRSPDATSSPAIDSVFSLTEITNEAGEPDYGFYWSSTTLISYPNQVGWATYVSFGRALGYMNDTWIDVHGAGAQRSDPKVVGETYEFGHGPQGDAVRSDNYVLCVSGGTAEPSDGDDPSTLGLTDVAVDVMAEGLTAADEARGGDGGPADGPPGGPADGPDLAAPAARLGITEQELMDALGTPPPDLAAAAATLGIAVAELEDALGISGGA